MDDNTWPVTIHEWETTVKVPISVLHLAEIFANMDDDKQARFFVAVAGIMEKWERSGAAESQAYYIGGHLRNCECSTEEARQFIRNIAHGIETSRHGAKE